MHTQKLTNFRAVSIVERVVWGKSIGNMKDAHGQYWLTRIGIKFLAHLSDFGQILDSKSYDQA